MSPTTDFPDFDLPVMMFTFPKEKVSDVLSHYIHKAQLCRILESPTQYIKADQ